MYLLHKVLWKSVMIEKGLEALGERVKYALTFDTVYELGRLGNCRETE